MSAAVETMFYVRETPWHGLGIRVEEALSSDEALRIAGLNWGVTQQPIYTGGKEIFGYKANVRDSDHKILGVVSDRYRVIQNTEAFAFTDELIGHGVKYETAGSLCGGKRIWLLARMPHEYVLSGERIAPYLVFTNTHDGSGAVKVALTPVRVVCNNTLNLALTRAKRSWSMIHTGDLSQKIHDAGQTLGMAEHYMETLGQEFDALRDKTLTESQVEEYIVELFPMEENPSVIKKRNVETLREGVRLRYFEAPDLKKLDHSAYRFVNAVSDFATHGSPLRKTASYQENLFIRTVDGNPMIDRAYEIVNAA